jgi:hypothetical protein
MGINSKGNAVFCQSAPIFKFQIAGFGNARSELVEKIFNLKSEI